MNTGTKQKLKRAFRSARFERRLTTVEVKLEQICRVVLNPQLPIALEAGDVTPSGLIRELSAMVEAVREANVDPCSSSTQQKIENAISWAQSPIDTAAHFRPFGAEQAAQAIEAFVGLNSLANDFEVQISNVRRASQNFVNASREASLDIITSLEQSSITSDD